MWTQLMYLSYREALTRGPWLNSRRHIKPLLKGKYIKKLAKEFRRFGLNPYWSSTFHHMDRRHNLPKDKKRRVLKKKEREETVLKNYLKADEDINMFRQEQMDKRRYGTLIRSVYHALPVWIEKAKKKKELKKMDSVEIKKKQENEEGGGERVVRFEDVFKVEGVDEELD